MKEDKKMKKMTAMELAREILSLLNRHAVSGQAGTVAMFHLVANKVVKEAGRNQENFDRIYGKLWSVVLDELPAGTAEAVRKEVRLPERKDPGRCLRRSLLEGAGGLN
jgi:hypothetical protein